MTIVSYICFSIFLLLIGTLFKKNADIFSPARLFIIVWSFALGLTDLKLSKFQMQWPAFSWIVLSLALGSFLIGCFVVYVMNINISMVSIATTRKIISNTSFEDRHLFVAILSVFGIYAVAYIVNTIVIGYVPLFTLYPSEFRVQWGVFGFGLLTHLAPPVILFSTILMTTTKAKYSLKISSFMMVFIVFISQLFLVQRFDLVLSLFLVIVFLYYGTKKINYKSILIFLLIIVSLMYGITSIRVSKAISDVIFYDSDMKYNIRYAFFTEPYMYISMNIENFAHAVAKLENHTYGYYTFDFILALTGLKHWIAEYFSINDFPFLVTSSYNTYTMFFAYYRDFGIAGIALIPFIYGAVFSSCYYQMRKRPTIVNISVYGIFAYVIIFSFFIPMLSWLHFAFNLSVIYLVSTMIERRIKPRNDYIVEPEHLS